MTSAPKRPAGPRVVRATRAAAVASPPATTLSPQEGVALGVLGLLALMLFGRALVIGWIADDYVFLDAVRRFPLGELLTGRHAIEGFYRPVSRELYFWLGDRVLGLSAGALHVLNLLVFVGIGALVFDLARRWAGPRTALVSVALFVLYPPTGALMSWVSCAQDLIALGFTLAALALAARGRHAWVALAVFLAALSKETAFIAPLLLTVVDVATHAHDDAGTRARRLWPGYAGLVAAFAVTLAARSTWPAMVHRGAWSVAQLGAAWKLPFEFLRTFVPPATGAGLAAVGASSGWRLLAVPLLAVFVVPGDAPVTPVAGTLNPLRLRLMTLALMAIGLAPVAVIAERWRDYYMVFAAFGTFVLLAAWLVTLPSWLMRTILAVLALVHLGSNAYYEPESGAQGAARHPFVNIEFFHASAAVTDRLLAPLEPSCDALRAAPRMFAVGVPSDLVFRTVLGPGLRVACRDTALSVRFLTEFRVSDATERFGVVRWLANEQRLVYEPSNALTLARIGEGFLLRGRADEAAACFDAATRALPEENEFIYPHVLALAASGHVDSARAVWRVANAAHRAPSADTLLARFAYGVPAARRDSTRVALAPLVVAAARDPADADAAVALGRALLATGLTRQATLALSVASGIAHRPTDLVWLGQALEAGGETDLAREAYTRALAAGLPKPIFEVAKARLVAIGVSSSSPADTTEIRPDVGRFSGDER